MLPSLRRERWLLKYLGLSGAGRVADDEAGEEESWTGGKQRRRGGKEVEERVVDDL